MENNVTQLRKQMKLNANTIETILDKFPLPFPHKKSYICVHTRYVIGSERNETEFNRMNSIDKTLNLYASDAPHAGYYLWQNNFLALHFHLFLFARVFRSPCVCMLWGAFF